MKEHFSMLAAYNRWANLRLYEAAEALGDADYRSDRGAFFGSVHGTLNHLLVSDRIWMQRFTGTGTVPDRLDAILFDDLSPLAAARRQEDARIILYAEGLTEADLARTIRYRTIGSSHDVTQPLAPALANFFNHQTHHRGQVHCLLTILRGRDFAPSLDLLKFQEGRGPGEAAVPRTNNEGPAGGNADRRRDAFRRPLRKSRVRRVRGQDQWCRR